MTAPVVIVFVPAPVADEVNVFSKVEKKVQAGTYGNSQWLAGSHNRLLLLQVVSRSNMHAEFVILDDATYSILPAFPEQCTPFHQQ